jgi:phosphate/sulfate permease
MDEVAVAVTTKSRLALSALAFAVLWTAFMWWWTGPQTTASTIILVITGVLVGLGWYWLYGKWYRRQFDRQR